jgi:hypothetical protein
MVRFPLWEEKMQTIRFDAKDEEEGLRIIILNGMVEYTEDEGVYRVPNYVLELLKEKNIRYHPIVNHNGYVKH